MASSPAWLTAKVDQKLALMKEALGVDRLKEMGATVVMTPLSEPPEGATPQDLARWELSCDGCGVYCPSTMVVGVHHARLENVPVEFVFGACPACREAT